MNVEVRDAATVVLLRDGKGTGGPEVFFLQRNHESIFVPGAHLFPGGAVDPSDRSDAVFDRSALSPSQAARILGRPDALAFWIAAVRECFEEAGVLLAARRDGTPIDLDDHATAERFARHRHDVDSGRRGFDEVCVDEDLLLSTDSMAYLAHWITPVGAPRRYDTRFFVAPSPLGQRPLHDDVEAIASTWTTPEVALDRHARGEWSMILPTVRTLDVLHRYGSVDELHSVIAGASLDGTPALIDEDGGTRVVLPGDAVPLTTPATGG